VASGRAAKALAALWRAGVFDLTAAQADRVFPSADRVAPVAGIMR